MAEALQRYSELHTLCVPINEKMIPPGHRSIMWLIVPGTKGTNAGYNNKYINFGFFLQEKGDGMISVDHVTGTDPQMLAESTIVRSNKTSFSGDIIFIGTSLGAEGVVLYATQPSQYRERIKSIALLSPVLGDNALKAIGQFNGQVWIVSANAEEEKSIDRMLGALPDDKKNKLNRITLNAPGHAQFSYEDLIIIYKWIHGKDNANGQSNHSTQNAPPRDLESS